MSNVLATTYLLADFEGQVAEIIYDASKGSKYFNNEEQRDKALTYKIERILSNLKQLEKLDLAHDLRKADEYIAPR